MLKVLRLKSFFGFLCSAIRDFNYFVLDEKGPVECWEIYYNKRKCLVLNRKCSERSRVKCAKPRKPTQKQTWNSKKWFLCSFFLSSIKRRHENVRKNVLRAVIYWLNSFFFLTPQKLNRKSERERERERKSMKQFFIIRQRRRVRGRLRCVRGWYKSKRHLESLPLNAINLFHIPGAFFSLPLTWIDVLGTRTTEERGESSGPKQEALTRWDP